MTTATPEDLDDVGGLPLHTDVYMSMYIYIYISNVYIRIYIYIRI